jgi:hypothetical protein
VLLVTQFWGASLVGFAVSWALCLAWLMGEWVVKSGIACVVKRTYGVPRRPTPTGSPCVVSPRAWATPPTAEEAPHQMSIRWSAHVAVDAATGGPEPHTCELEKCHHERQQARPGAWARHQEKLALRRLMGEEAKGSLLALPARPIVHERQQELVGPSSFEVDATPSTDSGRLGLASSTDKAVRARALTC